MGDENLLNPRKIARKESSRVQQKAMSETTEFQLPEQKPAYKGLLVFKVVGFF